MEETAARRGITKPSKNAQTKRSPVKQEEKRSFSDQGANEPATTPKTPPKSSTLPPWAGMKDFGRPKKFLPRYHPNSAPTVLGPRAYPDRIVKEPRIHSSPLTPVEVRGKRSSNSTPSPTRKMVQAS
ncbi:uncharacterized protein B0J16DRAFT_383409 [Fusarium flagelliforme]|uniref:Sentrin-specific protease senp8 (Sumo-specific protease) n=1 Tax=Fusarium flagelliforme TaxID=2675880 RepID=A0A395MQ94_9HYPO|nr:uncharacterized protein B0J16DRAFT_383409 [Fusarium flagelliforme]KAH7189543.1 hypothetical protein B0J16DRAFT_383409 [Fusarium flagelliforme]RFN50111.1 sentrin-specific protease senp8 (sumo-specific protease) [Fusarium flagelliforme]